MKKNSINKIVFSRLSQFKVLKIIIILIIAIYLSQLFGRKKLLLFSLQKCEKQVCWLGLEPNITTQAKFHEWKQERFFFLYHYKNGHVCCTPNFSRSREIEAIDVYYWKDWIHGADIDVVFEKGEPEVSMMTEVSISTTKINMNFYDIIQAFGAPSYYATSYPMNIDGYESNQVHFYYAEEKIVVVMKYDIDYKDCQTSIDNLRLLSINLIMDEENFQATSKIWRQTIQIWVEGNKLLQLDPCL